MKHTYKSIAALTILILFAAFLGNIDYAIDNPFIAYLYYVLNIFVKFLPIFVVLFSLIIGLLIWKYYSKKHDGRKTIHSFIHIFGILFVSIFSAFIILVLIALIQLNTFSLILNYNPEKLGVKTDQKEILLALKNHAKSPKIIASQDDSRKSIVAISRASSGENLYGNVILSGIPKILIFPIKKDIPNIMLLDNVLIINKADIKDIEIISPIVSNLFLQKYFPLRQIRAYPKVSVMSDEDYNKFREDDVKDKISKINTQADKMKTYISSSSASLEDIKEQLDAIELSKEEVLVAKDKEYNDCLNKGEYINGEFIRSNSKRDCKALTDNWENDFIEEEKLENNLKDQLNIAQKKLSEYEYLNTFFEAQQKLTDLSASNIPSERGLFIPKDKLQIVLFSDESNAIPNYFVSLVHEYLHYASYTPGKRLESAFFEEGLTEYFARGAIKDNMQIDTYIGYPLTVKVLEQFLKKLPEEDMADIYFSKDQEKLENTLNLVYGDDYYKNNIVQIETLQYTSDEDEAIQIANNILKTIDSEPLSIEDIYSK